MEYKRQLTSEPSPLLSPRLIIHGGAGNITPGGLAPERRLAFRTSLAEIVSSALLMLRDSSN